MLSTSKDGPEIVSTAELELVFCRIATPYAIHDVVFQPVVASGDKYKKSSICNIRA